LRCALLARTHTRTHTHTHNGKDAFPTTHGPVHALAERAECARRARQGPAFGDPEEAQRQPFRNHSLLPRAWLWNVLLRKVHRRKGEDRTQILNGKRCFVLFVLLPSPPLSC